MTLGDMVKIGVMSAMTNTIFERLATESELANGSDEYIKEDIIAVTLFGKKSSVYQQQYALSEFQYQVEVGSIYEFFVTKAVMEYKDVME